MNRVKHMESALTSSRFLSLHQYRNSPFHIVSEALFLKFEPEGQQIGHTVEHTYATV